MMNLENVLPKVLFVLLALIVIERTAFAQTNQDQIKQSHQHNRIIIPLGKTLSEKQFKTINLQIFKQNPLSAQSYENDACVGIIHDDEIAKANGEMEFREYQSKYAIDLVIFNGDLKDASVIVGKSKFTRKSTTQDVKKENAAIIQNDENGVVLDRLTGKKYPYTQSLILRNKNKDDLNIFYFNSKNLIAIQYVVQC